MTRRGFTLVELLIAVTVGGLMALGLTQLLASESRMVGRQEALLAARQVARAATTVLAVDLRMTTPGGIVAAAPDSVTARVPVAFGVACAPASDSVYVALLPSDPGRDTTRTRFGLAKRLANGYDFSLPDVDTITVTDSLPCTSAGVRVLPGGGLVLLQRVGSGPPPSLAAGDVFYLYQELTYRFAPSTMVPGRLGLWGRVGAEPDAELAAPVDSSSGFGFLLAGGGPAQATPPADLNLLRGLELRVAGESERWPSGDDGPRRFALTTRLYFVNRSD